MLSRSRPTGPKPTEHKEQREDALKWSEGRLNTLLTLPVREGEEGVFLRTTGVTSCTGEAYLNKRKGKVIPGYELEVKVCGKLVEKV